MKFSIIIVSWNVRKALRENLLSLPHDADAEVVIVDNASQDGSAEMVQEEFPQYELIRNTGNLGFAKACNQGLAKATGEYLILLNPDMKIFPETLPALAAWLTKNPQADVTGISLRDSEGQVMLHVRRFPHCIDQLAIVLKIPHFFPHILDSYLRSDFNYNLAQKVDSIRGAFFAIKRSAYEKYGGLDERYFIWFEEVDYCRTIAAGGGQVWYTPAASAIDFVGQSFKQLNITTKQNYFKNSMLTYFKKWHPWWQKELLALAWDFSELLVQLASYLNIKPRTRT